MASTTSKDWYFRWGNQPRPDWCSRCCGQCQDIGIPCASDQPGCIQYLGEIFIFKVLLPSSAIFSLISTSHLFVLPEVSWQCISSSLERRLIRQWNLRHNPLLLNLFFEILVLFNPPTFFFSRPLPLAGQAEGDESWPSHWVSWQRPTWWPADSANDVAIHNSFT